MDNRWFVYDLNGNGFETFISESAAKNALKYYAEEALREVGQEKFDKEDICWGELVLKGRSKVLDRKIVLSDVTE